MRPLLFAALLTIALPASAQLACGPPHALAGVAKNGRILVLEDETVWHLDDDDAEIARAWAIDAPIVICGNQITNREATETVTAVKTEETPDDVENEIAGKPPQPGAETDADGQPPAGGQAQADDPAAAGDPVLIGRLPGDPRPKSMPP